MTTTLDARTLMERLIAFPTVSRDSNLDLIDFVEKYLNGHGIASTRVPTKLARKRPCMPTLDRRLTGALFFQVTPTSCQLTAKRGTLIRLKS